MNAISKAAAILGRKGGQAGTGEAKARFSETMKKAAQKRWGDPKVRFWKKVDVRGPDECWNWKCGKHAGYGSFTVGRKPIRAHRFAWECLHGPIPKGMDVLHTCDNPACCNNLKHLFLGTPKINSDDMKKKLRHTHGENHSRAKITNEQALQIRFDYYTRKSTATALARKFGMSQGAMAALLRGRTWRHIAMPIQVGTFAGNHGEFHNRAKLKPEQVKQIRELSETGKWSTRALAAKFGISSSAAHSIVRRQCWKNI